MRVRGLGARGLCALLLVAAVLSMHGIPSTGTARAAQNEPSATTSHTPMSMSQDAPLDVSAGLAGASAPALTRFAGTSPSNLPHDGAAHLWAACLAVLLAGMLLVGAAVLARRRGSVGEAAAGRPPSPWCLRRCLPPRPPDLFALCVIRT